MWICVAWKHSIGLWPHTPRRWQDRRRWDSRYTPRPWHRAARVALLCRASSRGLQGRCSMWVPRGLWRWWIYPRSSSQVRPGLIWAGARLGWVGQRRWRWLRACQSTLRRDAPCPRRWGMRGLCGCWRTCRLWAALSRLTANNWWVLRWWRRRWRGAPRLLCWHRRWCMPDRLREALSPRKGTGWMSFRWPWMRGPGDRLSLRRQWGTDSLFLPGQKWLTGLLSRA